MTHALGCPYALLEHPTAADCNCTHYRRSSSGSGKFGPTEPPLKYSTEPKPAMRLVDKPAAPLNPAMLAAMIPSQPKPLAAIIEVPTQLGVHSKNRKFDGDPYLHVKTNTGTNVAHQKIFEVNGHNYLFTSACCTECIKVKHKKMLRAYLIDHGAKPGLRLWWKVWRATR